MWLRLGRWVEFGLHFGRQNRRSTVPDRYLVHASIRVGKKEWYHGPDRSEVTRDITAHPSRSPYPRVDHHPDPEPLSWGIRKVATSVPHAGMAAERHAMGGPIRIV